MKKFLIIILVIFVLYTSFCFFVYFNQKKLIFFPSRDAPSLTNEKNIEEVYLETEDNIKLNGWFLNNNSDKTVIFFHGNGGNVFYNRERLKIFNELHLNALLFDYRGYGKSEGDIKKEDDLYKDADAAYQYVTSRGILPKNIILWGQSLGGAVAIHLAQNKETNATIIESAFYSMEEMASKQFWFLPIKPLLKFHFRSDKKISNILSPILVIHSADDEMISFLNGKKLFNQAREPKVFLETGGSHNGGFQKSYSLYYQAVKKFLKLD